MIKVYCPYPLLDKKGGVLTPRANVIRAIETLKEHFSSQDICRVKNPDLQSFTWSQKMPFVFYRLDYWLTSFHLFDNVKNVDIVPAIKTDHSTIIIEFQSIDQQLNSLFQALSSWGLEKTSPPSFFSRSPFFPSQLPSESLEQATIERPGILEIKCVAPFENGLC